MHDRVCGVCVTSGWGRSVVLVWSAHTPLLRLLELRRGTASLLGCSWSDVYVGVIVVVGALLLVVCQQWCLC